MKIFAAVGTQKFPFDRLIDALDDIAKSEDFDVYVQYGNSKRPICCDGVAFLDADKYREMLASADVVVAHGGVGTIRTALSMGAKVVAVPRRSANGEHVDDHQMEIVSAFAKGRYVIPCYEFDQLVDAIKEAAHEVFPRFQPMPCTIEQEISDLCVRWGFIPIFDESRGRNHS